MDAHERRAALAHLLTEITEHHGGFLTPQHLEELATLDRLRQILVRCGNGRFTCAAHDVKHFTEIILAHAADRDITDPTAGYVRDVSLLASDAAHMGDFAPVTNDPPPRPRVAPRASQRPYPRSHGDQPVQFSESDCSVNMALPGVSANGLASDATRGHARMGQNDQTQEIERCYTTHFRQTAVSGFGRQTTA